MAAAAIGAALVLGASQASAATVVLKDTDTGATDILNTTGELTGGDSAVKASKTGIAFTDIANFVVNPGEELTSYSVTNLGTSLIGQITGGTAEIFQVSGMTQTAVLASLVDLTAAPVGVVSQHSDFSNSFDLGPGDYELKIVSTGYDAVKTQKAAKFSVELQGTAVPEPATWGVMLVGFGAIGASIRNTRRRRVAAIA
jgi:hypothetical protein